MAASDGQFTASQAFDGLKKTLSTKIYFKGVELIWGRRHNRVFHKLSATQEC